ncbi:MAG: hypothetical protein U5K79_20895 [Cyclobacteriaceae bacterium]|nr:hypothetical protein [Cyclobacteriaceae bacterium]
MMRNWWTVDPEPIPKLGGMINEANISSSSWCISVPHLQARRSYDFQIDPYPKESSTNKRFENRAQPME